MDSEEIDKVRAILNVINGIWQYGDIDSLSEELKIEMIATYDEIISKIEW